MGVRLTMRTTDVQALFDMCVGSLNFGSDWFETSEVEVLRRVATRLGIDPKTATPIGHYSKYGYPCVHCTDVYKCVQHREPPRPCGDCGTPIVDTGIRSTVVNIVGDFATGREVSGADTDSAGSEL